MAHFAKIKNDIVVDVIVIDNKKESIGADFIADELGLEGEWIQTSYNSKIRANFAGIGFTYDREKDVFIPPKPVCYDGEDYELTTDFKWKLING